jgi:hypothetical protein
LREVVEDHEAFVGVDVEEVLGKVEIQYCAGETGN